METFIVVIEEAKDQIVSEYVTSSESFNSIKLKDNLELIQKKENKEINTLIPSIESIIKFSVEKNILLLCITSNLWSKL